DMTDAAGAFYSAEDADSVISPDRPNEKGEGAFYIWSAQDLPAWLAYRMGVREGGNVDHDPHGEFTGKNILYRAHTVEETAQKFGVPVEEMAARLRAAEAELLAGRASRVRPHLDDKILTSWNGLMISAFALGGAVLREPRYGQAALRAAEFII